MAKKVKVRVTCKSLSFPVNGVGRAFVRGDIILCTPEEAESVIRDGNAEAAPDDAEVSAGISTDPRYLDERIAREAATEQSENAARLDGLAPHRAHLENALEELLRTHIVRHDDRAAAAKILGL